MRLYLDCEWADPEGSQLVSLALVDSAGGYRHYCEIDPLPTKTTYFVLDVVYPRLQGGYCSKDKRNFCLSLRNFLIRLKGSPRLILSDHENDFALLRDALNGFGQKIQGPIPEWKPILVTQGDALGHVELYFDHHPEATAKRHHAGVDAEALRWAFEYVFEGAMQ